MKNLASFLKFSAVMAVAGLASGCDGYEMVKYTGFPYGNERTAGSGVAYVRVKMMPEKGPVLERKDEKKAETPAPPKEAEKSEPDAVEPEPVKEFPKEAEELFKQMQVK